ncbi:alpha/beta hydrolase [Curtobacterium sp. ODYSSEY 48 V2]|uniref:alpha/beta hydrolase n=1 Tax=Curtobacterium sp. ODYSSEY 48 V2 TaxID=2939561 RepID=UPI00203C0DAA|nr:alpha/beta hydrolase fold domain-containing protein [Curtobacterium sp. ODYSSEY 48 V2]MCM3504591.1 alpha/beta hydrolase [Curtobacterium sp. ODYSSEY 48 V2]
MGATIAGPHGPVPVRQYGRPGRPTLVWLHGGGFFRGGLDQPESHAVATAVAAHGLAVVTVDYRLAPLPGLPWVGRRGARPRARWPHAHDDVLAVVRHTRAHTDGPLLLGGASAGACLASAATLGLLDAGDPPEGVVLAYGFHHARLPRDRAVQRTVRGHRRVTHAPWALDVANRNAVPRTALGQRTAFAGGQDLTGFPPAFVVDAASDAMRASGERFAAELVSAGTSVERHVLPDRHAFLNRPGTPAFRAAVDRLGTWATATGRFPSAVRRAC